ncbi:MAG: hypothetical protein IPH20_15265 [Bacteroidales bacterium]|nr:hypothetical protein [Bacteroidales bacterium]
MDGKNEYTRIDKEIIRDAEEDEMIGIDPAIDSKGTEYEDKPLLLIVEDNL